MQIRRLVLVNFGQFRGRNEIDLTPRKKYRQIRPVILIGGTNGAGKTTILEAIRLCLYGPLALGERVSQEEYNRYLRDCIHRSEGTVLPAHSASVGLSFEFAISGKTQEFHVERTWDCKGRSVTTNLSVIRNGTPLDEIERANADEFLRDLIPRGVSQLFFFDGEKIQAMAQAGDDDAALAEAVSELLGLDILSRLRGDLSIYAIKSREAKAPTSVKQDLVAIEVELQKLQGKRLELVRDLDQCQSRQDTIKEEILTIERKFSRSGGSLAKDRDALKAEELQLKHSIEEIERGIRGLCTELLPLTLCPQLCLELRDQLKAEAVLEDWQSHQRLVLAEVAEAKRSLATKLFDSDSRSLKINSAAREQILGRVEALLDQFGKLPETVPQVPLVHSLSVSDSELLLKGIDQLIDSVPKQSKSLEAAYEQNMRRLLQVKSELEKIPDDEALEPLIRKSNELNKRWGKAEASTKRAKEDLNAIDHQLELQMRQRKKKEEELLVSVKANKRTDLVGRVQAVLSEYSSELTKAKIAELSTAVAECFNQLWRKGDLLHSIKIEPATCSVMLLNKHGQVIAKDRLSAGERQMYAISLLWALARVSGRVLPMVIDTPLARLDSKHRSHLVTRYFPRVSHQVIILSTDTEIDQEYFHELGPAISHAYHLRYDDSEARTVVEEGYFWSRRGIESAR